jgi:hypothetical protein
MRAISGNVCVSIQFNHGWTRINTDEGKEKAALFEAGFDSPSTNQNPFPELKIPSVFISVHPWLMFLLIA